MACSANQHLVSHEDSSWARRFVNGLMRWSALSCVAQMARLQRPEKRHLTGPMNLGAFCPRPQSGRSARIPPARRSGETHRRRTARLIGTGSGRGLIPGCRRSADSRAPPCGGRLAPGRPRIKDLWVRARRPLASVRRWFRRKGESVRGVILTRSSSGRWWRRSRGGSSRFAKSGKANSAWSSCAVSRWQSLLHSVGSFFPLWHFQPRPADQRARQL